MITIKTLNHIEELATGKVEKDTCLVKFRKLVILNFLGCFLYFISQIVDFWMGNICLNFTDKNRHWLKSTKILKFQFTF